MKRLLIVTLIAFSGLTALAQQPTAKPDTTKWVVKMDNLAIRNQILHMIDTSATVINNADIPAKDRVKTVGYLRSILEFMLQQFQTQNQPKEEPKKK